MPPSSPRRPRGAEAAEETARGGGVGLGPALRGDGAAAASGATHHYVRPGQGEGLGADEWGHHVVVRSTKATSDAAASSSIARPAAGAQLGAGSAVTRGGAGAGRGAARAARGGGGLGAWAGRGGAVRRAWAGTGGACWYLAPGEAGGETGRGGLSAALGAGPG